MMLVSFVLIAAYKVESHFGRKKPDKVMLLFTPLAMLNAEAIPPDDVNQKKLTKGFTRKFILLHWSVMGMVLTFCFLCNLRAMILKPQMESPIDTTEDLLLAGKTPIVVAGLWQEYLKTSVNNWQRKAETKAFIIPNPMFIKKNLETLVLQDGTHSVMATPPVIANALKNNRNSAATHFSKENIGSYYSSWVISKLSPWKKIVNDHIGLIQQVTS
jgi:hypothetical protein